MQGRSGLILVLAAAAMIGLAVGCSRPESPSKIDQGGDGVEGDALLQVVTVEVLSEDLSRRVTMPGSVMPLESAELFAKVGGYLESIHVDIGDQVRSGQILANLSIPEMIPELRRQEAEVEYARSQVEQQQAALIQAKSSLVAADAQMERLGEVRKEKEAYFAYRDSELARWAELLREAPSIEMRKVDEARHQRDAAAAAIAVVDADVVSARARIAEAKAAVQKAEADLKAAMARVEVAAASRDLTKTLMQYSAIKAPFDGVISDRHVHPGAFIRPASTNSGATPLLRIDRIDKVRVSVELPMDTVAHLDCGDRVIFDGLTAAPGETFAGAITRMSGVLGMRSRMMRAEVEFDNPADERGARKLRPGMYGSLTVILEDLPATPTVPASAVVVHDGVSCVLSVEAGVVNRRPIDAVFRDGTRVGIGAGLQVGQTVIASGTGAVDIGQRVRGRPAGRSR